MSLPVDDVEAVFDRLELSVGERRPRAERAREVREASRLTTTATAPRPAHDADPTVSWVASDRSTGSHPPPDSTPARRRPALIFGVAVAAILLRRAVRR